VIARPLVSVVVLAALAIGVSGCVPNAPASADSTTVSVTSTATDCSVSDVEVPSGTIVFEVENAGDEVTEFYVLASDGLTVKGEVENIGPGISRNLVVALPPGDYLTACKPGMVGTELGTAAFTVTDSGAVAGARATNSEQIDAATANYAAYVVNQVQSLLAGTREFTAAYSAGDLDAARALYAPTRVYWERVETVAESFGDLDPRMDLREADLEEGQDWTGWHAMEKDLWPQDAEPGFTSYTPEKRAALATQLETDTESLYSQVQQLSFGIDQLANGAIGLLDEVASGKVTGEEEIWSHTDLWDFQANVDGASVLYTTVRDILLEKDAELAASLDVEFAALQGLLDAQRVGDGFRLYTELSPAEVRALSDQVNALAEPLSHLTAALLG
jgi:iron uptake system component EfeO